MRALTVKRFHAALGLAVIALGAVACAPMGHGGHHARTSTVTVAGTGTVSAAPDMAEITSGVVTQAPTAAQALAANSQAMERLLQALGALGIATRDIQTTNISVSPLRRQSRDGQPPEITGYEVTNQVRVKVRDLSILGRVLDQQVGQGANLVHGIQFGRQEPEPLRDEARRRAMADARRKAELGRRVAPGRSRGGGAGSRRALPARGDGPADDHGRGAGGARRAGDPGLGDRDVHPRAVRCP